MEPVSGVPHVTYDCGSLGIRVIVVAVCWGWGHWLARERASKHWRPIWLISASLCLRWRRLIIPDSTTFETVDSLNSRRKEQRINQTNGIMEWCEDRAAAAAQQLPATAVDSGGWVSLKNRSIARNNHLAKPRWRARSRLSHFRFPLIDGYMIKCLAGCKTIYHGRALSACLPLSSNKMDAAKISCIL